MTSEPDPGSLSDDAPPRRRGFGAAYWASIIVGLIMILAGAVIGFFGPRLFPAHPAAQSPTPDRTVAGVTWQPAPARLNRPPSLPPIKPGRTEPP